MPTPRGLPVLKPSAGFQNINALGTEQTTRSLVSGPGLRSRRGYPMENSIRRPATVRPGAKAVLTCHSSVSWEGQGGNRGQDAEVRSGMEPRAQDSSGNGRAGHLPLEAPGSRTWTSDLCVGSTQTAEATLGPGWARHGLGIYLWGPNRWANKQR